MKRKLVATLACRNTGTRLFGKPLQNLDVKRNITILDNIIRCLQSITVINEVVLGIADGVANEVFKDYANKYGLNYIIGDENDVLSRLIKCGREANATDVFRVTSEDPFVNFEMVEDAWKQYLNTSADALFLDNVIAGCGFEIISMSALEGSHLQANLEDKEHCTTYIRNNVSDFKISRAKPPEFLVRQDMRLTVDYPEDLVICRHIFNRFGDLAPRIPLNLIVSFLDDNPNLTNLVSPFVEK